MKAIQVNCSVNWEQKSLLLFDFLGLYGFKRDNISLIKVN